MRRAACSLSLLVLAVACGRKEAETFTYEVVVDEGPEVDLTALSVSPAHAVVAKRFDGKRVVLSLRGYEPVTLEAPFACPTLLGLPKTYPGPIQLNPLFYVGPARRTVGFDRPVEIEAKPTCDEAQSARVTLSVLGGTALATAQILDGGTRLSGRTVPPPALSPRITAGILPVADAERGVSVIGVETRLASGRVGRRSLEIAATTRASGLANVALRHHVLVRGDALRLTERPEGSRAELRAVGALFELLPDVPGRFVLEGTNPLRTVIESGRYDETPLDCGRADCHREIAASAQNSPMTHAFANDLGGSHPLPDPGCALACHTTGEPGVDDGGFSQVVRELDDPAAHAFADLPRDLRRLGGVGCLACHGPGSIPEPSSRFALLGRGVCAVCHDAPPAYGHAHAFATSRMASADRDPRTHEPPCARCHTTFGALARPSHRPPPGVTLGLGCATCHDVHPHAAGAAPGVAASLLRDLPLPETLGALPASLLGSSRVCVSCHAPSRDAALPDASVTALLLGRGGTEPRSGAPLTSPPPHASAANGCLTCHRSGPEGIAGASHAFAVGPAACSSCHAPRPRDPALAARARTLFARLGGALPEPGAPAHATPPRVPADPTLARAFANVALVLEDPAADVHHPRYAALLLDTAESALAPRLRAGASSP